MPSLPTPELPKPQNIEAQSTSGEFVVPYPEDLGRAPRGERLSQASNAVAQATASVIPPVASVVTDDSSTMVSSVTSGNPAVADDVDVMEKEWVSKAKQIVDKTKTDPHQQSVEISYFKYDYMKKRYGKELRLPEERAA